jgi:hypothetical protein
MPMLNLAPTRRGGPFPHESQGECYESGGRPGAQTVVAAIGLFLEPECTRPGGRFCRRVPPVQTDG